jgi:hypothetical protein
MNKVLFSLCLYLLSWPALCQKQPTFQTIVESVELHKTTVRDVKTKFEQETEELIGDYGESRGIYFKNLGIRFLGFMDSYANHIEVNLNETSLSSKAPYFKRGLTVEQLYRKLGEPQRVYYHKSSKEIRFHYKDGEQYELYPVTIEGDLAGEEYPDFKLLYPQIKKLPVSVFYIDLWHKNPAPIRDLMEIEE